MYDPTFGETSLARHLRKNDFFKEPSLRAEAAKQAVLREAVTTARSGFVSLPLTTNNLAGRTIYQVTNLSSELVLRKAGQNIRTITKARQSNRMEIIRRLKLFCEEGMSFTIVKMDIRNFYPSIDQASISGQLQRRLLTAPSTRRVLLSFLEHCNLNSISGLPPGLAISAELSELYMQDFDRDMRQNLEPHYYARYVDDIILVLSEVGSVKALRKRIGSMLPEGLHLNSAKSKVYRFSGTSSKSPAPEDSFDYLGYKFTVHQVKQYRNGRPQDRTVELDIAKSKVKKNKTRICRSFLQYLADGNFEDLQDRVRVLTCGYQFFDERRSKRRNAGIQYTYDLIDAHSPALTELDVFLKGMVLGHYGKIGGRLALCLGNRERKKLLRHSFSKGMANKVHFRFDAARLVHLIEAWKYA